MIEYNDFLERNFDGFHNVIFPLAHTYLISKVNNETYSLNEMIHQPGRVEFVKAIEKEVSSLFDKRIEKSFLNKR